MIETIVYLIGIVIGFIMYGVLLEAGIIHGDEHKALCIVIISTWPISIPVISIIYLFVGVTWCGRQMYKLSKKWKARE